MTIRKLCYAEAPKVAEFMQKSSEVATKFIKAEGNVEITMDATKANTMGGWRRRLRPGLTGDISALADGAAWIWDVVRLEFGKVRECLDVYHALEHLSGIGKLFYGEESSALQDGRRQQKKWWRFACVCYNFTH